MQALFAMTYNIAIDSGNSNSANIFWELSGPGVDNVLFSGTADEPGQANDFIIIDQAGSYTITFGADVPLQEFQNSKKSVTANIDTFSFEVTSIPEPSSAALLMLAGSTFLLRRKR